MNQMFRFYLGGGEEEGGIVFSTANFIFLDDSGCMCSYFFTDLDRSYHQDVPLPLQLKLFSATLSRTLNCDA